MRARAARESAEWSKSLSPWLPYYTVSFPSSLSPVLCSFPPPRYPFLFLPFFFWTNLPPLDTALLFCVTFPLICPFSCKGNQPRCSLISGQSYLRLLSQLRLIAAMLMTHRMGSWAPECCQQRWSPLCSLKPMLQIRPGEERRIMLLVKVVLVSTYCKLHRRHYLHSIITVLLNNYAKYKSRADTKKTHVPLARRKPPTASLHCFNILNFY